MKEGSSSLSCGKDMLEKEFIEKVKEIVGETRCMEEEALSRHTTFRVGGPADLLVKPSIEELVSIVELCSQKQVPYTIIGNGSNLLVSDQGIRGVVMELGSEAQQMHWEGSRLTVQAGAMLSKIAHEAATRGLSGLEFAAGIPGTVGGAVVMNAGAYGGEIAQVIQEAEVLTKDGKRQVLSKEELELSYRHSVIPQKEYIVLGATFLLEKGNQEEIVHQMDAYMQSRREKQPLNYPSAGSTFKRPEGYFAGKLIMDAGLRGYQVGGAQVSEKHCGFVINRGEATAKDILTLMQDVQRIVEEKYQVTLEPEVKMLGEF